ncbi:MAG TPA: hypothetical protein VGO62_07085, partial [Myxococcota bacterium]|jgi:type II secretory pathway component PulC
LALAMGTPMSKPLAPLACPYANVAAPAPVPVPVPVPVPAPEIVDAPATPSCSAPTLIERAQLMRAFANVDALTQQARIVPALQNDRAVGLKLFAIRPDSIFAQLGFHDGDTVTSINGFALTAEKALEAYARVRDANDVDVALVRNGAPCRLEIHIADEVF